MKYNKDKKIKIKTVQIDNQELEKCKSGKEFKVKLITKSRPIIVDPPRISLDERIAKAVTKSIAPLRDLVMKIDTRLERVEADLSEVKTALAEHGKRLDKIETRLDKIDGVLSWNNLH